MAETADDQSGTATGASAEAPAGAATTPDIQSIAAALVKELNLEQRFSGITTLVSNKVSTLERQINDLKTAGLSPEEQEQVADQERQRLITENALLKIGRDRPEAVAAFEKIMGASTLEDQLAAIESVLGPKAAAQVSEAAATAADAASDQGAEATPALPSGNPNNPARTKGASISGYVEGEPMTAELAAAIFAAAPEKGALAKARDAEQG